MGFLNGTPLLMIPLFVQLQYYNESRQQSMIYESSVGIDGAAGNGNTLTPKEFHDVDTRMQNRLEYLAKTCSNYGLDKPGNYSTVFYIHTHNRRSYILNILYSKNGGLSNGVWINSSSSFCIPSAWNIAGNDSLHKPNAWEFLINRQYHVIW